MAAKAPFDISSLLTPAQVQADLMMVSSFVVGSVSPETKTLVHDVAEGLLELAEAKLTVAEIDELMKDAKVSVPEADVAIFGLLLNGVVPILNLVIAKYEGQAPEVVAYVEAISNGLLASF